MALPGKFAVTPTGGATYSIPVVVPPGTAGMGPSLALAYNSHNGNGLLGVGWTLDGLPSIGRCPRTFAHDGVRGSVNYDANDRFCLDGQRLVAISGTYGANGTEYRTEVESFSKIVSHGTAGTGPTWFEVKTKSGQIMEFGNTTDSRVLAQGQTTARDWALNKVSDTKGNYFTVTYTNDTTNGQAYPTRIDYTANDAASLAAYNSVRFVYDSVRPDVVPTYQAGSLRKTTVRLTNVQTYAGETTLVVDYRLTYATSSGTGRSQLTSVAFCDGAETCLPATSFAWQSGGTTQSVVSNVAGQDGTLSGYRAYIGDFNADGLADILWDAEPSSGAPRSTGTRVLWTATGAGDFSVTTNVAGQDGTLTNYQPILGDFSRDGRTDVWWVYINSSGQAGDLATLWTGAAGGNFAVAAGPLAPHGYKTSGTLDTNADGRSDALWYSGNWATILTTNADSTTSTASHNGCTPWPGWNGCSLYVAAGDFTGDGIADLVWVKSPSQPGKAWSFWLGNGDSTFVQLPAGSDATLQAYATFFADFNGDGKTDVLWDKTDTKSRSLGLRRLWLSKGDGTFAEQTNVSSQDNTLIGYRPYFGDFNGDGIVDVLWDAEDDDSPWSTGVRVLWVGKGDGTFTVISNFAGQDGAVVGYAPILGDFNGDGKTDILWDSRAGTTDTRSTGTRILWLSDAAAPDLVVSITTGVGANVAITYKPLTDSTVYTKDSTALDPLVDMQAAISVVSRIDTSNGIGGTVSSVYAFAGAKAHQDGRGFLGLREVRVTDLQTNVVQTTTYRQDFPFVGLAATETKKLGAAVLEATSNEYGAAALGGTRYQAFLRESRTTGADLDGSSLPAVTRIYQYDTYGNATQVTVGASDGHAKTTTNLYSNDTTSWLLGRLTRASVGSCLNEDCASCNLPWGGQIAHGIEIAAYQNAGSGSCVSETRKCINGSLSGSNQFAGCTSQTFTSSETFTVPAYVSLTAQCWGAGGGGGRGDSTRIPSGGGGGGYSSATFAPGALAGSIPVTIGQGGAGGTCNGCYGTAGGSSTFGTYLSAGGGTGGFHSGTSVPTGGTGTVENGGRGGNNNIGAPPNTSNSGAGGGGANYVQGGANSTNAGDGGAGVNSGTSNPGTIPGGGGGAAQNTVAGAGGRGECRVTWN